MHSRRLAFPNELLLGSRFCEISLPRIGACKSPRYDASNRTRSAV